MRAIGGAIVPPPPPPNISCSSQCLPGHIHSNEVIILHMKLNESHKVQVIPTPMVSTPHSVLSSTHFPLPGPHTHPIPFLFNFSPFFTDFLQSMLDVGYF